MPQNDSVSLQELPPSPMHSPRAPETDGQQPQFPEVVKSKGHLGSVLSILRTTHRYSAYTFSAFSIVHFLNTGVAPLLSPVHDLTFADENLTAARALYRYSYLTEAVLVFGALGVHVASGVAIRAVRVGREYIWYKHNARLPKFSWNAITGYIIVPFVIGHFLSTRYMPWKLDIDVTSSFIGHYITSNPRIGWAFYTTFVGMSALHMANGLGQWLGWRKNTRYSVNAGVALFWLAGLIKVVAHGLVGGFKGRQYQAVNDAIVQKLSSFASA